MTRKLVVPFFVMMLGFLTICAPMFAHHGTAGVFDHGHRITTRATVTDYIFANPHVQIHFTLKNDKGEEETWGVETASPGNMLANGWTKKTFKPGDELPGELRSGQGRQDLGDLYSIRVCCRWPKGRW